MQVFRRTQTLVGLMCWLAEKKTRSPFRRRVGEVRQAAESEQIGGGVERQAVRGVEPLAGQHLVGDRVEGRVSQLEGGNAVGHAISLGERR